MESKGYLLSWLNAPAADADFEELYRHELPRIYNYFRFRLGDGPLAEDLTSETFVKAWGNRRRYRRDLGAFSTWLFTIARRVALDHYRSPHREIPLDSVVDAPSGETVEDIADRDASFTRLSILLARLTERERELVALKYGAGLTNRLIARLTGLSEANVAVILHRTVQALRSNWENDNER
jgi:RNA polymerase sigma-70 factor (ECF subfamily)